MLPTRADNHRPQAHKVVPQYSPWTPRSARPTSSATLASGTPGLRINRVLGVMLHTHWSASVVRVEFKKALALWSEIRRRNAAAASEALKKGE